MSQSHRSQYNRELVEFILEEFYDFSTLEINRYCTSLPSMYVASHVNQECGRRDKIRTPKGKHDISFF